MNENLPAKPSDCTCAYPHLIARNMCGHTPTCPVYQQWAKDFYGTEQPPFDESKMQAQVKRWEACFDDDPKEPRIDVEMIDSIILALDLLIDEAKTEIEEWESKRKDLKEEIDAALWAIKRHRQHIHFLKSLKANAPK